MDFILTFSSTNTAIKAETILLEQQVKVSVAPLPPSVRAGCGISLRIASTEVIKAVDILSAHGINDTEIYIKTALNSESVFSKIDDVKEFLKESPSPSLLETCPTGGCGAKISPDELNDLLKSLPICMDTNLIVGYSSSDDAAVYKLNDHIALVTTVDFFPPMVDDPRTFGRIAAANALSDVYAMGGKPITALNIVSFPQSMDISILKEILIGGAEKIAEASCSLAGGHSIYSKEPKYGLSVTGIVHPDNILRNNNPQPGHALILTKALGTGLILAALRGGAASENAVKKAIASMERLNKYAAEKLVGYTISACTDITGFGLLAHALELAGDFVSLKFYPKAIPYFDEAYSYAEDFMITAAAQRNRNSLAGKANISTLPFPLQELLFDPQTSGGLLISVDATQADALLADIKKTDPIACIIGEVIPRQESVITF